MVLVLKAQFTQSAVGITAGNDTCDLGIGRLFIGQILNAFALSYRLRNALIIGIHTVGRNLLNRAGGGNMIVVGIDLLPDTSVDRQIRHRYAAIVDVDLAERFRFTTCGKRGGREHTEKHDDG